MFDPSLESMLHHAAFAPITRLGWLRITGEDRVRWLNGMATNAIAELQPGTGNYNFFLNSQGKIQADGLAFLLPDSLLLETDASRLPALIALLDRFIIMDDVELQPLPGWAGLAVTGPDAAQVPTRLGLDVPAVSQPTLRELDWQGSCFRAVSGTGILVPRLELWGSLEHISSLSQTLTAQGIPQATDAAVEQLRILEGTPLHGQDIRDKELPQETAPAGTQSRALHFSKGCYLGQEIVERIHSRGNVNRAFSGFILTGKLPPAGTTLASADAPDKTLGELTSVTQIGHRILALGYLRREAQDRGLPLSYPGGTATPASLPFPVS